MKRWIGAWLYRPNGLLNDGFEMGHHETDKDKSNESTLKTWLAKKLFYREMHFMIQKNQQYVQNIEKQKTLS